MINKKILAFIPFVIFLLVCLFTTTCKSDDSPRRSASPGADGSFFIPEATGNTPDETAEDATKDMSGNTTKDALVDTAAALSERDIGIETVENLTEDAMVEFPNKSDEAAGPAAETETWVAETLMRMSVEEKIGQLLMVRVPGGTVYQVDKNTRKLAEEHFIGGYILFSENVQSLTQVQQLTADLQSLSEVPLFIATDEEGGRVSRIGTLYEEKIPPAFQIGQQEDPEAAYTMGHTIGERLISLGINMDFAPVADIWSNDANTVIGNRAFGREPERVGVRVEAAVRGLQDAGVMSVIKHLPGHGDTAEDSHHQLAVYPYGRERFDHFEAIPFTQGIAAGAAGVMVGHIATPLMQNESAVLDWMEPWRASGQLPATFSDYWMKGWLRRDMGYSGLIVTDGLEMKALTSSFTGAQIALGAFMAGADLLLIPSSPTEAFTALRDAYNEGIISSERLDASVRRILRAKAALR